MGYTDITTLLQKTVWPTTSDNTIKLTIIVSGVRFLYYADKLIRKLWRPQYGIEGLLIKLERCLDTVTFKDIGSMLCTQVEICVSCLLVQVLYNSYKSHNTPTIN